MFYPYMDGMLSDFQCRNVNIAAAIRPEERRPNRSSQWSHWTVDEYLTPEDWLSRAISHADLNRSARLADVERACLPDRAGRHQPPPTVTARCRQALPEQDNAGRESRERESAIRLRRCQDVERPGQFASILYCRKHSKLAVQTLGRLSCYRHFSSNRHWLGQRDGKRPFHRLR